MKTFQTFIIDPVTGKEIPLILEPPEPMPTSTPIPDKGPKPSSMPSNGYVSQPIPRIISPVSPLGNGYVTHSMFNVS